MRLSGRFRTCCASHSRYHLKSSKLVIVRRVGNSSLLDELGKHSKMDRIDESTLENGIAVECEPASSQWMANRHRIKRHGEVLQRSLSHSYAFTYNCAGSKLGVGFEQRQRRIS